MIVVCGQSENSLVVTADDNLLEHIITEIDGDTLRIRNEKRISPTSAPTFEINVADLNSASISGSGVFDITSVEGGNLDLSVAGSGKFYATGNVDSVSVGISGSGQAELAQLVADNVDISVNGSGKVMTHAQKKLDVSIAGSGKILYSGDPKVSQSIAGSGQVRQIDTAPEIAAATNDEPESEQDGEDDDDEEDADAN